MPFVAIKPVRLSNRLFAFAWVFILLLAAGLRLYRLDLIDIRYDEALAPLQALNITRGEWLGLAPYSGSVINHPPLYLYLLALPYLFTRNLFFIAAFRVLLDVAAVGLCWWLCQRYWNRRVANIASLLFAVAPWAIQSSRKLSIEALALCSLILVWGLLKVAQDRNPNGWVLTGLGAALCIGVHLSSLPLLLLVLIVVWVHRETLRLRPILLGVLPLLVLLGAYLWHDSINNFENVRGLLKPAATLRLFTLDGLLKALWMSGGAHLSDLTGQDFPLWQAQPAQWLAWIDDAQIILFLLISIATLIWLLRAGLRHPLWIVWLWWWIPVLSQSYVSQAVQLHYFTLSYPALFILVAVWLDRLLVGNVRWGRMVYPAFAMLLLWQGYSTLRFTSFVDEHWTNGGYGNRLRDMWAAKGKATAALAPNQDLIAVINGFPTPWNEQAVLLRIVLADVPHRFLNSESDGFVMQAERTQYLFAPETQAMQQCITTLFAKEAITQTLVPSRANGDGYTHIDLMPTTFTGDFITQPNPVWANHLELQRYRAQVTGDHAHIDFILRVQEMPAPNADVHWTIRLLQDDQQIAQRDIAGVHPDSWRAGDLLYITLDVPLDANAHPNALRIGSYTYPDVHAILVSIPGQPADDGVRLAMPSPQP